MHEAWTRAGANRPLLRSPTAARKGPGWLDDPRGPDVSESMTWIPIVTFWPVAADHTFAGGVPPGHGHRYGANVVEGWVAVDVPDGWADEDTARLHDLIEIENEIRSAEW